MTYRLRPFGEQEIVMRRTRRPRHELALDENVVGQRTWLTHLAAGRIKVR
jgi:hypothetical protein